jgi:hypothetical protein
MASSSSSNVSTEESWEPLMGPKLIGRERRQLTQFLRAYRSYFAFNMKELGALIGPGIRIELVVTHQSSIVPIDTVIWKGT